MFADIGWPPKLANIPPCYVFLLQIINRNLRSSHSLAKLANMVQGKKVGNQYIGPTGPPGFVRKSLPPGWFPRQVPIIFRIDFQICFFSYLYQVSVPKLGQLLFISHHFGIAFPKLDFAWICRRFGDGLWFHF